MRYYLRTLEGIGRKMGGVVGDYAIEAYKKEHEKAKQTPGITIKDAYVLAWKNYINSPIAPQVPMNLETTSESENELNKEKLLAIRDYIISKDSGQGIITQAAQNLYKSFSNNYYSKNVRKIKDIADAEIRRAAAEASAEAKAKEEAEAFEMMRRAEEEAAAEEAADALAEYQAIREEIANNLNYIKNGQMILTTPEALEVYKELTGRDYSEILARDDEAAAIYESEVKKMEEENEVINISPVVVSSEHEYTIIEEDSNTITYQDETGKIYIEPKAGNAWPWIIAGGVALLLLL